MARRGMMQMLVCSIGLLWLVLVSVHKAESFHLPLYDQVKDSSTRDSAPTLESQRMLLKTLKEIIEAGKSSKGIRTIDAGMLHELETRIILWKIFNGEPMPVIFGDDASTTPVPATSPPTTTMDPIDQFCQEACKSGYGGAECHCPDHPVG